MWNMCRSTKMFRECHFCFYCFSTVSFTEIYDKPELNNNSINIWGGLNTFLLTFHFSKWSVSYYSHHSAVKLHKCCSCALIQPVGHLAGGEGKHDGHVDDILLPHQFVCSVWVPWESPFLLVLHADKHKHKRSSYMEPRADSQAAFTSRTTSWMNLFAQTFKHVAEW